MRGSNFCVAGKKGGAPDAVAAQDGFGIAVATKGNAEGFEFTTEVKVVVDFAIEDEDIAGGLVAHRLIAGFGEIENGETGVAEPNGAIRRSPFRLTVRAAVAEGGEEAGGVRGRGFRSEDA